ncbi:MAG TPA: HAMP domain-containing sensor histidine kinase [Terriglobia bacterium]|nr:HAMP domain-containing sensor histidine kinase [Terriglobia bacterium]
MNLRFRTRLALVMFLTMACTTVALMVTYVRHDRQVKAYTTVLTSDLLQIVNVTQQRIPQNSDRTAALEFYSKALKDAGLTSVTVALPSGEVVASSNPAQVGKKIPLKKRRPASKENPIQISAELQDVDIGPGVEPKTYNIEFPIVQGEKVLGYVQIRGEMDAVGALLRKKYVDTLALIVCTMLMGMFAVVYLAFRFTKPIDLLVVGAQQVAQGNLYVTLPQAGQDEIGKLSATFNQMVERLRQNRELQDRLNEAEKLTLLGRFAAVVAHEVRNSLNFINLSIDQIRAKHTDGDARSGAELQRNLQNIKEEIGRLNHLVNDFLSVGRQMPPALAPVDLRATLGEAISLAEKQGRRQNVKFSVELPAGMPVFQLDAGQIKTCFLNILTNAIQAMPRGGEVHITAHTITGKGGAESLQLRFADNGPGIPPEDREKVFTPFYSTKATGFGLGLAIAKKIVEDHGGRVFVTEGETPGTVVVMEFPLPEIGVRDTGLGIRGSGFGVRG